MAERKSKRLRRPGNWIGCPDFCHRCVVDPVDVEVCWVNISNWLLVIVVVVVVVVVVNVVVIGQGLTGRESGKRGEVL